MHVHRVQAGRCGGHRGHGQNILSSTEQRLPCTATEQCIAGPELRTVFPVVTLRAIGKHLIWKVDVGGPSSVLFSDPHGVFFSF